jgi:protein involved in polysaccharide export with SLBB domain
MTRFFAAIVLIVLATPVAHAQTSNSAGAQTFLVSRTELTRQLAELEAAAAQPTARAEARRAAAEEAERIRRRLEEGDFRTGDQVALFVAFEPTLTDTFAVSANRELELPGLAAIPMVGVLRSELNDHLSREIGRYIRDPQVRATSLLRVTVTGEIGRPGFYVVDSHALLSDVLTLAGGLNRSAALDRIRVERSNRPLWDGNEIHTAIVEGRTLDQLSLQAGDQIIVPEVRSRGHYWRWGLATIPPLVWMIANLRRL